MLRLSYYENKRLFNCSGERDRFLVPKAPALIISSGNCHSNTLYREIADCDPYIPYRRKEVNVSFSSTIGRDKDILFQGKRISILDPF